MPYDSSGNYSPPSPPIFPAVAGTVVQSGYFNSTISDLGAALTTVAGRVTQLATGPFTGFVGVTPLGEVQTATAGQTLFPLATFAYSSDLPGAISVFVDGIKLPAMDITQTSATSVTIATALVGGEQVELTTGSFSSIMSGKSTATHTTTANNDVASYQFRRNVEYSGGTPGFVNACIRADTWVDNAGATAFEWAIVGVVHNQATGGQNVGGYFQGIKYSGAGPTWGSVSEVIDQNSSNPTNGVVGIEVDVSASGTDTNNCRVIADLVWRRQGGVGPAVECSYGLRFNSTDALATLKNAIAFTSGAVVGTGINFLGASLGIGIDFSGATVAGPSINLNTNQSINLNGNAGIPANTRQFFHNGLAYNFTNSAGTNFWNLNDTGTLVALGVQLLGARQTGFTAMTGSSDRVSVFNTATVTLAQLASRVNAIQAALTTHGLIGA